MISVSHITLVTLLMMISVSQAAIVTMSIITSAYTVHVWEICLIWNIKGYCKKY